MAKKQNKFIQMIADGFEDEIREFAGKNNIDLDKLEKFHAKHLAEDKRAETQKMINERAESGDLGPAMIFAMNHQKITVLEEHGRQLQKNK
jgi:hypothetical protein